MELQKQPLGRWLDKATRKLANHPVVKRMVPKWSLRQAQDIWNRQWANPNFAAAWVLTAPPQEVEEAVQTGWFPSGTRVLDIGCGSGELSAWLASQGFEVLGIDFAENAIQRARAKHKNFQGNLSWRVVDICRETPGAEPFDVLIDRGCLHGISVDSIPLYVRHITACCAPGARFLLFHKTAPVSSAHLAMEEKTRALTGLIKTHFQPAFEIIQISPTTLLRATGDNPKQPMAGLAIRMVRQ